MHTTMTKTLTTELGLIINEVTNCNTALLMFIR